MTTQLLRNVLAASLLTLAACQPSTGNGAVAQGIQEAQKGLQKASKEMEDAKQEIAQAQHKLDTENMSLSNDGNTSPKAELTPAGELLIDGKPVAMTAEQKALGHAYRTQLQSVASDGIAIGMEGAKLGIDAAASALKGILDGQSTEEVGKQAEAVAKETIKPKVEQLCARLPALLKAQQAWAAAQPEFRPYATMDQSDVDDCMDKDTFNF
jgi:hypothetical protein